MISPAHADDDALVVFQKTGMLQGFSAVRGFFLHQNGAAVEPGLVVQETEQRTDFNIGGRAGNGVLEFFQIPEGAQYAELIAAENCFLRPREEGHIVAAGPAEYEDIVLLPPVPAAQRSLIGGTFRHTHGHDLEVAVQPAVVVHFRRAGQHIGVQCGGAAYPGEFPAFSARESEQPAADDHPSGEEAGCQRADENRLMGYEQQHEQSGGDDAGEPGSFRSTRNPVRAGQIRFGLPQTDQTEAGDHPAQHISGGGEGGQGTDQAAAQERSEH